MEDKKTDQKVEEKIEILSFESEIDNFIKHIESQAGIFPLVMNLITAKIVQETIHVDKFIKSNELKDKEETENKDDDEGMKLLIPMDKINEFIELTERVDTTELALDLLPVNFIVSFVSQYDAFLGRLIKTVFHHKPELLNNSEKNLLFSELLKFKSIDEAREFVVEKEVEAVLRDSHLKQFKWLENKLSMPLRKDLPSFSSFIEITERRNLYVHCNGFVSRQYLDICRENSVDNIDKVALGEKLKATPAYFGKCYSVLFEIGVKLGQVIWRKLLPEQLEEADDHLNNVCFELLKRGHNKLALNLLTFATETLKKHHNQEIMCIFTINKALAYYLSDKKKEATKILSGHDWSAASDNFKLAVSVLNEDFENALTLMKSIGKNNDNMTKEAYQEWPLFTEFRKRDDFKEIFKDIYKEDLLFLEKKPKSLEEIVDEIKEMKQETEKEKTAANNV